MEPSSGRWGDRLEEGRITANSCCKVRTTLSSQQARDGDTILIIPAFQTRMFRAVEQLAQHYPGVSGGSELLTQAGA